MAAVKAWGSRLKRLAQGQVRCLNPQILVEKGAESRLLGLSEEGIGGLNFWV